VLGGIALTGDACLGWRHANASSLCSGRKGRDMLPHGAVTDRRTQARLGGGALSEVLAALWPGDCQSCDTSLGSDKPYLAIDDLHVFTRAAVHQPGIQYGLLRTQ
jgi:hypothetical protein